jgi:leucyl-tRNA synthetase
MMAPFAPHTAEELYLSISGNESGLIGNEVGFPVFRPELAVADEIEIAVQVNGKLRSKVFAAPNESNGELE